MVAKKAELRSRAEDVISLMDNFLNFIVEEKAYPLKEHSQFFIHHKSGLDRDFKLLMSSLVDVINTQQRFEGKDQVTKRDSLELVEEITKNNIEVVKNINNNLQYKILVEKFKLHNIDIEGFEKENMFAVSPSDLKNFKIRGEELASSSTITNIEFQKKIYREADYNANSRFNLINRLDKKGIQRSFTNRYLVAEKLIALSKEKADYEKFLVDFFDNDTANHLIEYSRKISSELSSEEKNDLRYSQDDYYLNNVNKNEAIKKPMDIQQELYKLWTKSEYGIHQKGDTNKYLINEKTRMLEDLVMSPESVALIAKERTADFKSMLELFTSGDVIPTQDAYIVSERKLRIYENLEKINDLSLSKKEFVKALLQDVLHYSAGSIYGQYVAAASGIPLVQRNNEFSPADIANKTLDNKTVTEIKKSILDSMKLLSRDEDFKKMSMEIIETIQNNKNNFVIDTTASKVEGVKIENLILESFIEAINLDKDKLNNWLMNSEFEETLSKEANIGKKDSYIAGTKIPHRQITIENYFAKQSPSTELMSEVDWKKHLGTFDKVERLDQYLYENIEKNSRPNLLH
jgi:predicted nucleic acid-binding protein